MESMRALVEAAIAGAPYARKLGIVSEEIERDRVRLRLPFDPSLVTIGDLVHGGAIASLVDVAATAACWASPEIPRGARGTTIGLSLSYLGPGRGQDLVAEAHVVRRGGSTCVAQIDVHGADGVHVARASATYKLSAPAPRPAAADPAETLAALFSGKSPAEQDALLARLERAGAARYRALAADEADAGRRAALLEAAAREEANAALLEGGA